MASAVSITVADGIARITVDDGKANALNGSLLAALDEAIGKAESEHATIVLTGRTGFFSGGLDLKTLPALETPALKAVLRQFMDVMLRLFTYRRPVVAAATGHAIAGGCIMLLGADERLATDGPFRIGLNETQLGLSMPTFAVEMARAQLLPAATRKVVLQGELLYPQSALEIGLVDAVVPAEVLLERATARAKLLAALPERAYGDTKLALRGPAAATGRAAFDREIDAFFEFFRGQA